MKFSNILMKYINSNMFQLITKSKVFMAFDQSIFFLIRNGGYHPYFYDVTREPLQTVPDAPICTVNRKLYLAVLFLRYDFTVY